MQDASFDEMLSGKVSETKEVGIEDMLPKPKPKEQPKPTVTPQIVEPPGEWASTSRLLRGPLGVAGIESTKPIQPQEPGPIKKAAIGFWDSTIGGLKDLISEAYDSWKSGDLNRMTHLGTMLVTGGALVVDPAKGITKGGLTSETGRNIITESGDPTKPLPSRMIDLVEAVPFIGPMIEETDRLLQEGETAKGIGFGLGVIAGTVVGEAAAVRVRRVIRDRQIVNAARRVAERYKVEATDTSQIPMPQKLVVEAENKAKLDNIVKEIAKEEIVKADAEVKTKSKAEEVKAAKVEKVEGEATIEDMIEPVKPAEQVTEVDLQTGTPVPEALSTESHPLRQPGNTLYDGNKSVAADMNELRNLLPDRPVRDPGTTLWKLINDVNRWLDGEEIDIAKSKDFLSDIAVNADEFRYAFAGGEDYPNSFLEWKSLAEDAAEWARKSDRAKNVRTDLKQGEIVPELIPGSPDELMITGDDIAAIEKYFGKDLDEIPDADIRSFMKQRESDPLTKSSTSDTIRTPEQEAELAKLISEQSEDVVSERFAKRRKTRTSLYFGLPLDEAGRIMKDWYSQLREYAVAKLGNRASGQQIKATLRKGSTADEWKAVNLDQMLEDGKVYTKAEVLQKIDEGTVELKDVMLGSIDDLGSSRSTKFGIYVEPGGTNYKELFVTAPDNNIKTKISEIENLRDSGGQLSHDAARRKIDELKSKQWRDGHADYSDIENPIVRLRMNDRTDAQGNKVLFIEEIQAPQPGEFEKMPAQWQKRWREIGMKRAIKYAIDNGYDKVAWTTGEMQAKRYSLERRIDGISYLKRRDGNYYVVLRKDGNPISDHTWNFDQIRENLGEDTAKRIAETADYNPKSLSVDEINVGGQGLRRLYDRDLPNVVKRLGGKVESIDINLDKKTIYDLPRDMTIRESREALKIPNRATVQSISIEPLKYRATKGFSLYSGVPVDEAAKVIVDAAKRFSKYVDRAHEMKGFDIKKVAKATKEEFNRAFLDRSGNIRVELLDKLGDVGYNIIQRMYLSKGASAKATAMLKQMRKEVYGGFSRKEKVILDKLILATRMVDIGKYKTEKQFKFPKDADPMSSASYLQVFGQLEKLSPERVQALQNATKAYYEWMKKPLKEMLDEGLISQEEFDRLVSHNYRRIGTVDSPLTLADLIDKKYETKIGNVKRTVYDSGIERLARGKESDIYEPSSEIMALETFNRAYGRIMNNQANRTLLDLARADKQNPFVRFKGEDKSVKIPSGFVRHFVYEGGERKSIWLHPELSKEWITNTRDVSPRLAKILRYASLSPVTRTFATGIEWSFALANIPRDIMHTWFAARVFENGKWKSVYSPHLPVFVAQIGKDAAKVLPDALLRKGRWKDYIDDGGGMDFLVHQARPFQKGLHLEGPIEKAYNVLGHLNETSEIITRLAIRDRVLSRGKSRQEATFAARDYMDFAQGGWFTKTADNFFPYLNASVIGTRSFFRSFKGGTGLINTYKMAQFATVVIGLYLAAKQFAPKTSEALQGDQSGQNNLIIPLGDQFGFVDSKGQMRYPYFKIPIDPSQKFFKKFFEASTDKWLGNPVDVKGTVAALKEMSPVGISNLPATVSGAIGYMYNEDFWRGKEVTRKTFDYPNSKEEWSEKTPEGYVDFGQLTGLSPDRTKFVVDELIANSMWADIVGFGYEKVFGNLPKEQKEMHLAEVLSKLPISKRFIGLTNPYSQFAGKADEIEQEEELKLFVQNRGLDLRVQAYLSGSVKLEDVTNYIRSFKDKKVEDRMFNEFNFARKSKGLSNLSFWMRMKGLPNVEARAKFYLARYEQLDEAGRSQLLNEERQVANIGGILTDEFRKEVERIRFGKK